MTITTALANVGSIVTYWSDDSGGYIEGKLIGVNSSDEAVIDVGRGIQTFVDLHYVHLGSGEEVDGMSDGTPIYEGEFDPDTEYDTDSVDYESDANPYLDGDVKDDTLDV